MNHHRYMYSRVAIGLERLVKEFAKELKGRRLGLVTHPAAVDGTFRSAVECVQAAFPAQLRVVFGPEHGIQGHAQDLEPVGGEDRAMDSGDFRIVSLYGTTVESLRPSAADLDEIDVLIIDLQDVGTRFYTFQATMLYCLEAALPMGKEVWVLDRPNPLGGEKVEGPLLERGHESFVGCHPIPIQHGLTMAELARLYVAERGLPAEGLRAIAMEGWRRSMVWEETGLPWVLPSPNMPTIDTAVVYPGQCLLEGTNLSEGRGTTRPFEICGAPGIDPVALAAEVTGPGVVARPCNFKPGFQKFAHQLCGGVQLHVTDRSAFRSVATTVRLLAECRRQLGDAFAWRTETYEFVSVPIAIDLLYGADTLRCAIDSGLAGSRLSSELAAAWLPMERDFFSRRLPFLFYS